MGVDTHSPDEAWLAWEKLAFDERCSLLPLEPPELEVTWRKYIVGRSASPKLWMDAFLAAWAQAAGLSFVTFDAGFRSYRLGNLQLLSQD